MQASFPLINLSPWAIRLSFAAGKDAFELPGGVVQKIDRAFDLFEQRQYEQAIPALSTALNACMPYTGRVSTRANVPYVMAECHNRLAGAYLLGRNNPVLALQHLEHAANLHRSYEGGLPRAALMKCKQAELTAGIGNSSQAEHQYREAVSWVRQFEKTLPNPSPWPKGQWPVTILASEEVYRKAGLFLFHQVDDAKAADAEDYLNRALDLYRRYGLNNKSNLLLLHQGLGTIALRCRGNFKAADQHFEAALQLTDNDSPLRAVMCWSLGDSALYQQNYSKGEGHYYQALAQLKPLLSLKNPECDRIFVLSLIGLSACLFLQGRRRPAQALLDQCRQILPRIPRQAGWLSAEGMAMLDKIFAGQEFTLNEVLAALPEGKTKK